VAGEYRASDGTQRRYSAGDPDLVAWVHVVFADAFLRCHTQFGGGIPGGADAYVREWATAGELMGMADAPRSEGALRARLDAFSPELVSDERVAEAIRFIRHPPLHRSVLPGYAVLFAGAVASLEPKYRRMLGLRRAWWPAKTATRVCLVLLARLLGRPSSSELHARRRIDRLAQAS
jgi:uncharacterized protein (DUF2236 family)